MSEHTHGHVHHESIHNAPKGAEKKSLAAYIIGLILSFLLTLISFFIVGKHAFNVAGLYISLSILAIAQLFVQVVCFLRLNANPSGRWNLMPFLFTIVIVIAVVGGSLWIMYTLNYRMVH